MPGSSIGPKWSWNSPNLLDWTKKWYFTTLTCFLMGAVFDPCPKTFGSDQTFLCKSKTLFGPAEGQGISVVRVKAVTK